MVRWVLCGPYSPRRRRRRKEFDSRATESFGRSARLESVALGVESSAALAALGNRRNARHLRAVPPVLAGDLDGVLAGDAADAQPRLRSAERLVEALVRDERQRVGANHRLDGL